MFITHMYSSDRNVHACVLKGYTHAWMTSASSLLQSQSVCLWLIDAKDVMILGSDLTDGWECVCVCVCVRSDVCAGLLSVYHWRECFFSASTESSRCSDTEKELKRSHTAPGKVQRREWVQVASFFHILSYVLSYLCSVAYLESYLLVKSGDKYVCSVSSICVVWCVWNWIDKWGTGGKITRKIIK